MGEAFLLNAQILGAERVRRKPVPVPPPPPEPEPVEPEPVQTWPLIDETEIGDILVQAGAEPLTVTMDSVPYQGSYVLDPSSLAAGPVNLEPPAIVGAAVVGQTLTIKPGLWSHDGSLATPTLAWQWLRDGAAIAGATGMDYATTSADAGKAVGVAETAQDAHGTSGAVSASLAIPAPPAALLVHTQRAKASGTAAVRVFAGMDLGMPAATRDIVVLAAVMGSAGATITAVKVAGVAAAKLTQTLSGGSGLVCIGAWLARIPTGAAGDVEVQTSSGTTVQYAALFRGEGLMLADSATTAVGSGATAAMTIQAGRVGGKVLAFVANNNGTAFDWTGGTELYDEDIQTGKFVSAAFGDVDQAGRASLSARRVSGTGQIAGLMIAF